MQIYNKLVRDKIPQIIDDGADTAVTRILNDNEYETELNNKLREEISEYFENGDVVELADVVEVIYAILNFNNISLAEFEQMMMTAKLYRELLEKEDNPDFNDKFSQETSKYLQTNNKSVLANVVAIIYQILEEKEVGISKFEQIRREKADKRGAFNERIFLEGVIRNQRDFYETFVNLIKLGTVNNTYKMAWAKSLVDLASENGYSSGRIPLLDISRRFIQYYWNILLNGDFKQGQRPPRIINLVKELMDVYGSNYNLEIFENVESNLKTNFKSEYDSTLGEIVKVLKIHVIWKFVNLDGESYDNIYQYEKRTSYITMKKEDLKTLKENNDFLIDLIDYRWGLIIERFMGSKTSVKITDDSLNPESLERFRTYLY